MDQSLVNRASYRSGADETMRAAVTNTKGQLTELISAPKLEKRSL